MNQEPAKVSEMYSLIEIGSDISSSDETSFFFDKSDELQANRTIMPLNSTIASETCIRMDKAATELWKMHISNGVKKRHKDSTIMPSYAQFLTDKTNKNWTLNSPPKRTDVQQCPQVASTSSDEYIQPVYMREEDFNRLFNKGYIYLAQGKMHYREPQPNVKMSQSCTDKKPKQHPRIECGICGMHISEISLSRHRRRRHPTCPSNAKMIKKAVGQSTQQELSKTSAT